MKTSIFTFASNGQDGSVTVYVFGTKAQLNAYLKAEAKEMGGDDEDDLDQRFDGDVQEHDLEFDATGKLLNPDVFT